MLIKEQPVKRIEVIIEDDVLIRGFDKILPGVKIRTWCSLFAGNILSENVAEYSIVAGNPQIMGYRE